MITKILVSGDLGSIDHLIRCFKISKAFIFKGIEAEITLNKIFTHVLKSYHIWNVKNMGAIFFTCLYVQIEIHSSFEEKHSAFSFMTKPL